MPEETGEKKKPGFLSSVAERVAAIVIGGVILSIISTYILVGDPTNLWPKKARMYDNFDNLQLAGSYDTTLWEGDTKRPCTFSQNDSGQLVIRHSGVDQQEPVICNFVMTSPQKPQTFSTLHVLEADLKTEQMGPDEAVGLSVLLYTDEAPFNQGWETFCGVESDESSSYGSFYIYHYEQDDYEVALLQPISANEWHNARLEVDSGSGLFSCYIDDVLLGKVLPNNIDNLRDVSITRVIGSNRSPSTDIETFVDNVRSE
jgi:hypothetical protein